MASAYTSASPDGSRAGKAGRNAGKAGRRASKRTSIVIAVLAFLIGVGLISYPYVSDYVHKLSQAQVTSTQAQVVEQTDDSTLEAERQKALDYNKRLLSSRSVITDPFDASTQRVSNDEYQSLMNLAGDGVMGTLVIPKINLTMPIYHGTGDDELQKGVGHLEETSLPYGGESSHAVLAGHNGLPSVRIFDDINKLEVGDYFILQVLGEDHAYRVTSTETVLPEETDSLVVEPGKDLVTLVTCTPYGINTHRLLVHAERTDVPDEWKNRNAGSGAAAAPTSIAETPLLPFTLVGLAVALGLLLAWWLAKRRKRGDGPSGRGGGPRPGAPVSGSRFSRDASGGVGAVPPVGGGSATGGARNGVPPVGSGSAAGGVQNGTHPVAGGPATGGVGFTSAVDAYKKRSSRGRKGGHFRG